MQSHYSRWQFAKANSLTGSHLSHFPYRCLKNYLKASDDDLKASDDHLKASDDDLKASDDDLKASDDDLKASDDDLKALDNDLKASDDDLKALGDDLKALADFTTKTIIYQPLFFLVSGEPNCLVPTHF